MNNAAAAVVTIFDRPRRNCSGCYHWGSRRVASPDGYLEAECELPKDSRDRKMKRASDVCSGWMKRGFGRVNDYMGIEF